MRIALALICFCFSLNSNSSTSATQCTEVPAKDARMRGEIFYTIVDKTCVEDTSKKSTCVRTTMTDYDRCKDPKTLLKQFCDDHGLPGEKEIACNCESGFCKK